MTEPKTQTEPAKARDECDRINQLQTRIGKGSLSNLVWNIRNKYLGNPDTTFTSGEVRDLVEGFMTEVAATRGLRDQLEAADETNRYARAVFRALDRYTFEDSDHGRLIAEAVKKLEETADATDQTLDYSQSDGERYRTALERIADQLSDVYVAVGSGDDRVYRSAYESLNMAYKIASEALEGE
jgi:DNA-binding FadR family transcriptional regulator